MADFLRRYTELPFLLHMLNTRKLTLLDPASWPDKNDAYAIDRYRSEKDLQAVLALCLTEAYETNHHWKTYAGSASGVCVTFHKDRLLDCLGSEQGLRFGPVRYLKIQEIRDANFTVDEVPFIKRNAFADENEFRIIFEKQAGELLCEDSEKDVAGRLVSKDVAIDLSVIANIHFSHSLPDPVYASIKELVSALPGCERIRLLRTTLNNNAEWQRNIDRRLSSGKSPSM